MGVLRVAKEAKRLKPLSTPPLSLSISGAEGNCEA